MSSAATTHLRRGQGNSQVAPAPQLRDDASGMNDAQVEAMRRAEEQAGDMEAVRTLVVYEERKHKLGKITKKKWFIIDPRTSNFIPY